ncbi:MULTISPECIES: glycosyltransferase family 2 protein [Methylomonas]|uniref:Glycosyltransferase 2-like domain-containing protein n=2 Tax=Methylomonas TaxID=416 RepID=A0A126T312_9GAMM|nr:MULTISPECIES: glycosyltransferase family 2 protein [Methylomonas]AMK76457.1 hypothetical protein JT25_008120 [Methylomonas denitrificans]OAH98715.1 hypothetical protein A1342_12860 [Methylomonas methanica]TCV88491.1 succinoglycan biosynthesis protein ExoO [Methylomonas methanica]
MTPIIEGHVKVSVIIPAYNASQYIRESILSAIGQVNISLEIIVCDDCSGDNTVNIVKQMMKDDSRIELLVNNSNSGPSFSRNRAISKAKGDWVALLDADDFYHKDRLSKLIDIGEKHSADIVADSVFYVNEAGKNPVAAIHQKKTQQPLMRLTEKSFIKNDFPSNAGFKYGYLKPVFRRSFLMAKHIEYNEGVHLGEDFMLYMECLLKGGVFLLMGDAYYYYRYVEKSLSRTGDNTKYMELISNNSLLINLANALQKNDAALLLEARQQNYHELIFYNDVVKLIKGRHIIDAVKSLVLNPKVWPIFIVMMSRKITAAYMRAAIK